MSERLALAFEALLPAEPARSFLIRHWERSPLHHPLSPTTASGLLSVDDVYELVDTLSTADADWIELRRVGEPPLNTGEFAASNGLPDAQRVFEHIDRGWSLILGKLHVRWPRISNLCRGAEIWLQSAGVLLSERVGAHLYYTPPNSQAVSAHYDDLNVFALQLSGAKHWRLHKTREPLPTEPQRRPLPESDLSDTPREIHLREAELLYLPRGIVHEARATGTNSLHVTLDVRAHTWLDLLVQEARLQPRLCRSILVTEPWALKDNIAVMSDRLREADLAGVVQNLKAEFVLGLRPLPSNGFEQIDRLEELSLSSVMRRRDGTLCLQTAYQEHSRLIYPGGGQSGPLEAQPVFVFLAETDRFPVNRIPLITDQQKLELVSALVVDGFLEFDTDQPKQKEAAAAADS